MNGPVYMWSGTEVITLFDVDVEKLTPEQIYCFVVDTNYSHHGGRYGMYVPQKSPYMMLWKEIPPADLPPEFRANLLLLGVS